VNAIAQVFMIKMKIILDVTRFFLENTEYTGISMEMEVVNQRRTCKYFEAFNEESGYGKVIIGNWYFRE